MSGVVPIFNESGGFIGVWAQDRSFEPSLRSLTDLRGLAEPTMKALTRIAYKRTENTGLVKVGANISFQDGVFLMIDGEKPPIEAVRRGYSFVATSYHGIPIAERKPASFGNRMRKSLWHRLTKLFSRHASLEGRSSEPEDLQESSLGAKQAGSQVSSQKDRSATDSSNSLAGGEGKRFVEDLSGAELESIVRNRRKDAAARERCHAVLRWIGPRAAEHLASLAGLLVDEDPETKDLARSALRGVMSSVVPAVLADLRDPDPEVRFIGVSVLSELAPLTDRVALDALKRATQDSNDAVALEATLALEKSTQG